LNGDRLVALSENTAATIETRTGARQTWQRKPDEPRPSAGVGAGAVSRHHGTAALIEAEAEILASLNPMTVRQYF
jgi:hypothetical protein